MRKIDLILMLFATVGDGQQRPNLDLRGEIVTPVVRPYQPVLLRMTLTNRDKPNVRLPFFETTEEVDRIFLPGQDVPQELRCYSGLYPPPDTSKEDLRPGAPLSYLLKVHGELRLKANESESCSFDLLPRLPGQTGEEPVFLLRPGEYKLRCCSTWILDDPRNRALYFGPPVAFTITEPKGDDAAVCRMLQRSEVLARVLVASHISSKVLPPLDIRRRLAEIVERYPKSSYAAYARHALAIIELGGSDVVEKSDPWRGDVRVLQSGKEKIEAISLGLAQKNKARALLEPIEVQNFAYGPRVLLLRRAIAATEEERTSIEAHLDKHFPDYRFWALQKKLRSLTPEEIDEIRRRYYNPNDRTIQAIIRGPRGARP